MNHKQIKLYDGAKVIHTDYGDSVVVGADSYIADSIIGDNVQINRRNIIDYSNIGSYSYTGANTIIKRTIIGKYCAVSWNVSMTGNIHSYQYVSSHPFSRLKSFGFIDENQFLDYDVINIGNDVWIGANATIMPGISIADGAVIGGAAVVTQDVPAYAIVVGNPARVIKYRFDDHIIEDLLAVKWWDWSQEVIKNNLPLFQSAISEGTMSELKKIARELKDR